MAYSNAIGSIVAQIVPDHSSPAVASFHTLDLNEGLMVVSITQPINVSTFNFADLSFQNSPVNEVSSINVSLTGGSCEDGCEIGRHITFCMAPVDLEKLKLNEGIWAYVYLFLHAIPTTLIYLQGILEEILIIHTDSA